MLFLDFEENKIMAAAMAPTSPMPDMRALVVTKRCLKHRYLSQSNIYGLLYIIVKGEKKKRDNII